MFVTTSGVYRIFFTMQGITKQCLTIDLKKENTNIKHWGKKRTGRPKATRSISLGKDQS